VQFDELENVYKKSHKNNSTKIQLDLMIVPEMVRS